MSIELIVFESPEEEKQTLTEAELADEQLYKLGLTRGVIEDLRSIESTPHKYTESDIADIAFSQVVEYSIPSVVHVKEEDIKKKFYLSITMPARIKVFQPDKKFTMYIPEGKTVKINGAKFMIRKQSDNRTDLINPTIPGSSRFTDEKQVIDISKNIWNIVSAFQKFADARIVQSPLQHKLVPVSSPPQDGSPTHVTPRKPTEEILQVVNTFRYDKQYLQHLFSRNLYDYYAGIRIFGEKSENAAEIKAHIESIRENEACRRRQLKDMWSRRNLLASQNSESMKKYKKPYLLLQAKEKTVIDKALKKNIVSSSPGSPFIEKLHAAIQSGKNTKDIMLKLLEFTLVKEDQISKETKYLKDGICPHEVYLSILYSKTYKNPIEREEVVAKRLKESFAEVELLGEVSCRICSEIFEDNKGIEFGIVTKMANVRADEYDKLYKTIWEEMMMSISRYLIIERSYKLKLGKIVEASAIMIRNEIGVIQHEIMKNKTATVFQVEKTVDVYIQIYIFAILTQLIFMNDTEIRFAPLSSIVYNKGKRGSKEEIIRDNKKTTNQKFHQKVHEKIQNGQARLQELINQALTFIRIIKGPELESSSYITTDTLKNAFVKAYKWVYSLNYVQADTDSVSVKRWGDYETPYTLQFTRYDPKALGRSHNEILKDIETKNVYETLKLPHESLKATHFYLTEKVYKEAVIPLSQQQQKYENMLKVELDRDYKVRISNRKKFHLISTKLPVSTGHRKSIAIPKSVEERCRCRSFSYVFEKNGKRREFTPDDVHRMVQENGKELVEFYSMKFIGEMCNGCRNQKYIDSSLESMFWDYFTNACPESDFHEYTDKGACMKCKINRVKLEERDSTYFNKYKKIFQDKRKSALQEVYDALSGFAKPPIKLSEPKINVQLNDLYIHKLVKEFNINYNIYRNIGLIYNLPYEKVQKGTVDPSSTATDEQLQNRNNKLASYFAEMMVAYNQIKYSEYNVSPSIEVTKILDSVNNKGFHSKIPKLNNHVLRIYRSTNMSSKDASLYLLNEIASFILEVRKKIPGVAGDRLAHYCVNLLIESEKLMSEYVAKGLSNDNESSEEKTQGLDADETVDNDDEEENQANPGLDAEFSELANDQLDMEVDADLDMDENLLFNAEDRD